MEYPDSDIHEQPEPDAIKTAVADFARAMEAKLRDRCLSGYHGWEDSTPEWLFMRMRQEVLELEYGFRSTMCGRRTIQDEAIDVANLAMMIWDVLRRT
jgi:hypothetical protein